MKKENRNAAGYLYAGGYSTVEAAILIPLCLGVIMLTIFLGIYMYNKTAAVSLASRAAVIAAGMEHEGAGRIESSISDYTHERIESLPMTNAGYSVDASLLNVKVSVSFDESTGVHLIPGIPKTLSFQTTQKISRLDPAAFLWTVKNAENLTKKKTKQKDINDENR